MSVNSFGYYDKDEESWCAKDRALTTWCSQYVYYDDIDLDILPITLHQKAADIINNRTKKERLCVRKNNRYEKQNLATR